ncbi:MAG: hypothetical protein WA064_05050 [Candidatus Moraniibacteriota bacterium]
MKKFTLIIGPVGIFDRKTEKLRKKAESVVKIHYDGSIIEDHGSRRWMGHNWMTWQKEEIKSLIIEPIVVFVGFASCSCCTKYETWDMVVELSKDLKKMGKRVSFIDNNNNKSVFRKRR